MHWTSLRPSYLVRRLAQIRFDRKNPGCPWITRTAIHALEGWLQPTDRGIEWGCGRSTCWYAAKIAHLTSIEDNAEWYKRVCGMIAEKGVNDRVDLRLVPCEYHEQDEPDSDPYADAQGVIPDGSLDFAMVDGNIRLTCMYSAMRFLKPGGLLVLDNANRYVPNPTMGGYSTIHEPRSAPRSPKWEQLLKELSRWRTFQTSDGIWTTVFWIKPS